MKEVHLLYHTANGDDERFKILGIFSSKKTAHAAIIDLKSKSGFVLFQDDFHITTYTIDQTEWTEGFG